MRVVFSAVALICYSLQLSWTRSFRHHSGLLSLNVYDASHGEVHAKIFHCAACKMSLCYPNQAPRARVEVQHQMCGMQRIRQFVVVALRKIRGMKETLANNSKRAKSFHKFSEFEKACWLNKKSVSSKSDLKHLNDRITPLVDTRA